ncbi:hypothetical protein P775_11660 [Puniceibacterium antarcticum]|uniref:Uncharacterized protein n=1 Tax=Puniceibacterium antarcticum TaxID=1206336 RepID=A0A2G8REK7_9RHOB|nr:hypothetical protein P775_11660 [Puniceibacterium antarcticum]
MLLPKGVIDLAINRFGELDVLKSKCLPIPEFGAGKVLIRVKCNDLSENIVCTFMPHPTPALVRRRQCCVKPRVRRFVHADQNCPAPIIMCFADKGARHCAWIAAANAWKGLP